jgi:hypothetical protein
VIFSAHFCISKNKFSRSFSDNFLESFRFFKIFSSKIKFKFFFENDTNAIEIGPASGPLPASSIPARIWFSLKSNSRGKNLEWFWNKSMLQQL